MMTQTHHHQSHVSAQDLAIFAVVLLLVGTLAVCINSVSAAVIGVLHQAIALACSATGLGG